MTRSGRRAARSVVDAPAAPRDHRPAGRYETAPEPSRPALPSRRQVRQRTAEPPQFIAPPAIRPVTPVPDQPRFPPASPPNGFNRNPRSAPPAHPAPPRSRLSDLAPEPGPSRHRPRGKARRALTPGRTRRLVVTVAVIAALIGVNLVLLMIRTHRATDSGPQAGSPPSSTSRRAPVAGTTLSVRLGVQGSRTDVTGFETWLGRKVQDAVYVSGRDSWAQISAPDLSQWKGAGYRLIYAVPLLPTSDDANRDASMRAGARGEHDADFTALGRSLVAAGQADAELRVGWEFNSASSPWASSDHEVFKQYFRHVVTAMRAVPGAKFTINWNVRNADNAHDGVDYYPGDQYVDSIGVDAYDQDQATYPYPKDCNNACRLDLQTRAWDEVIFGGERGLDFWSFFAAKHKKPMTLPEYGLWDGPDGSGGGDNPYFIQKMHDFIAWAPNNVVAAAYSDRTSGRTGLRDSFAGREYVSRFGDAES